MTLKEQIQQLERRVALLEAMLVLQPNQITTTGTYKFDPECLHNGCNHEKNPVCHLYCPHCQPTY